MTSGYEVIDNFIIKIQENLSNSQNFEWIPYEQFENIKSLASGGISNIRIAKWINGPIIGDKQKQKRVGPLMVVLKIIDWEKELSSILNQVQYHYICYNKSPDKFLPIYGITKDHLNNYISIIKYAEEGDLHDYLDSNFSSLNWNKKLLILSSFLRDLKTIHEQGFMHKDIHSKNILLSRNNEGKLLIAYLPTSGLTRPVAPIGNKNEKEGIYGILPYLAPEVLKGERPRLSDNAPSIYNEVIKMCWAQDPSVRPSINKLESIVLEWCDRLAELFGESDKE
ncbi:unnamed protein product [Rhizophagus irregularis]|nr:unnamed protein product [Rhizophagus irregularis]CAB5205956.1 unnamed protein product [Rhizophagus irregularis]